MSRLPPLAPAALTKSRTPVQSGVEEGDSADLQPERRDDSAGWTIIDDAFSSYLNSHGDAPQRWLLVQTLATAVMRRCVLASLGVVAGWRTIDIGTGFGPIPMELAAMTALEAIGVDIDHSMLRAADAIRDEVSERGGFLPDSQVTFLPGDAYALGQPDASIDLATARFVFQHLQNHTAAAAELARVVKPGRLSCVIDIDDGLSVTYPEPSEAYRRLTDALTARQERYGAGRRVARTLPSLLDRAGFDIVAVLVVPQADYRSSQPGDLNRTFLVERFAAARNELVEDGFISTDEFDETLARFSVEHTTGECTVEAHLAVLGRRR